MEKKNSSYSANYRAFQLQIEIQSQRSHWDNKSHVFTTFFNSKWSETIKFAVHVAFGHRTGVQWQVSYHVPRTSSMSKVAK